MKYVRRFLNRGIKNLSLCFYRLEPNTEAIGDHSSFKTDKDGKITNTATYKVNPQNPRGFQEVKRVDKVGATHNGIPTPHVHENGKVRPAKEDEL